ncbi:MAG: PAS domain S-box protein, partial [Kofleriaceae bacterium]
MEDAAYRLLFEASPRPMVLSERASGRIVAANAAAARLFGLSLDELRVRALGELKAPPSIELTPTEIELDGVAHVLTFVYDIRPYQTLERRFRLLVEKSADGIVLTDALGRITYTSPGADRLLGMLPGELVGVAAITRMHPDDARSVQRAAPGETVLNLHRSMHKDGRWRWFEAYTTNLTHDPAVAAHVTNFRDVNERHEADERLRRSEANFRSLIERLPTATLVHRNGRFLYVNPAAVAILGWDRPADLIGRGTLEFVHPDDADLLRQAMVETSTQGASQMLEVRMLRRDGSSVTIEGKSVLLDY